MKKSILIFTLVSISSFCFSQKIGIKLQSIQTFTVIPAHTQDADSIAILDLDRNDNDVYADIQFFKNGKPKETMRLKLWDTYRPYGDVSDEKVLNRVKNKLNIQ
jgi:hypothetical protein